MINHKTLWGKSISFSGLLYCLFCSFIFLSLVLILIFPGKSCALDKSICATINLEISQDITFERQSFDARMTIKNGFPRLRLENVDIDVFFLDEDGQSIPASSDPQSTDALFFIKVNSMENIGSIEGDGIVQPLSAVDVHWLIIPAPGASKGVATGTVYSVGAKLSYTISGKTYTFDAVPVQISVKPMPTITLDYFIPEDVYGDDAFTPEIEPAVPFTFGLRVGNNGQGTVRGLQISTAKPKILDNEQGLIIDYTIQSCEVNGTALEPTFTISLGNIDSSKSTVARWKMASSLSGRFTDFVADYSHSDNLGGQLTSLIQGATSHTLVHDVLMGGAGKDNILDFLAKDNDLPKVYESQNIQMDVSDISSSSSLSGSGDEYTLSCPATNGCAYIRLADPLGGSRGIKEVVRSDGKWLPVSNTWLSKKRNEQKQWEYSFNLFDQDTTGTYKIVFGDGAQDEHAPVLQFLPDRTVIEGNQLSFIAEATDEDGSIPYIYARPLPAGAGFTDNRNGQGLFVWPTRVGQAGTYVIVFSATDGSLEKSQQVAIRVLPLTNIPEDTNNNGIPDGWETTYFGDLSRNGSGDYDGDGISDLEEYLRGSDPSVANSAPTVPIIQYPENAAETTVLKPDLNIQASTDPDGDQLTYVYQIYTDEGMTSLLAKEANVPETTWAIPSTLRDNNWYYWRAQASDGFALTTWAYGKFFVNTVNDAPNAPQISSTTSEVDTRTPTLQVTNSRDVDGDILTYSFSVYEDNALTTLVASQSGIEQGQNGTTSWTVSTELTNNMTYYWKATATDEHGLAAETAAASFLVDIENTSPSTPTIYSPENGSEIASTQVELVINNSTDAEGDGLTYYYEIDTAETFDSPDHLILAGVAEQQGRTSCQAAELQDNTLYYWRAKANDGEAESAWITGSFFINTTNDTPSVPVLKNPANAAWVNTLTPLLEIFPSSDPDDTILTYTYEIYSDEAATVSVGSTETDACSWSIPANLLSDNTWYYWRVTAKDEHGSASPWMQTVRFFVDNNFVNDAATFEFVEPAQHVYTNAETYTITWVDNDPDSDASISLYYDVDAVGANGTLIAGDIHEDPDGASDTYQWDIAGHGDVTYYIYAIVNDGENTQTVYCQYPITIDRTIPAVTPNPPSGAYASAQSITLSANEPADIYYTLDGTDPTTASTLYSEPIPINENRTLKFTAVDNAGNLGSINTATYTIQQELIVLVRTDDGIGLSGLAVRGYVESGTLAISSATTDANGIAHFDPQTYPAGNYKFRVSYLGMYYWSSVITVPGSMLVEVVIDHESVDVQVKMTTGTINGTCVSLYNESGTSSLYLTRTTDTNGVATFNLPVGRSFKFRLSYLGSYYWTEVCTVTQGGTNTVSLNTGGGLLEVRVCWAENQPLAGVKAYLYNGSRTSALGPYSYVDADGFVKFNLPAGTYSLRIKYHDAYFWTEPVLVTTSITTDLVIRHKYVDITLRNVYQGVATPWPNIDISLYSDTGISRGQTYRSNESGQVTFVVPELPYKARISYLGQYHWSDNFTWQDMNFDVPMAEAEVIVTRASQPLAGLSVSVYTLSSCSTGFTGTTDSQGKVRFRLPAGSYLFRTICEGVTYWSNATPLTRDVVNKISLSAGSGSFQLAVRGVTGDPLAGLTCKVYDEQGTYLGMDGITDSDGMASFNLSNGQYKFRVGYMGVVYWSNSITVPDVLSSQVAIAHEWAEVQVDKSSGPVGAGIDVSLFDETGTTCLGLVEKTDEIGTASFYLPVGVNFRFRVVYAGNTYWSGVHTMIAGGTNIVGIDTGGGVYQLTVVRAPGSPLVGWKAYLYNETGLHYRGMMATTDSSGIVRFDVPGGSYSVRVDYQGGTYWTDPVAVTSDIVDELTIPHQDITVTIQSMFRGTASPMSLLDVYLFSEDGVYREQTGRSSTSGQVTFTVPELPSKARANYLGQTYWSDAFTWSNANVTIPMGQAEVIVTNASQPVSGITVYVYSSAGAYLGIVSSTDTEGKALLILPAGDYLFNAYYNGASHWSSEITLTADQIGQVSIAN